MHYKKIIFLILFLLITNCSSNTLLDKKINLKIENSFINRGFTLVYNDQLYKNKLISKNYTYVVRLRCDEVYICNNYLNETFYNNLHLLKNKIEKWNIYNPNLIFKNNL